MQCADNRESGNKRNHQGQFDYRKIIGGLGAGKTCRIELVEGDGSSRKCRKVAKKIVQRFKRLNVQNNAFSRIGKSSFAA